MTMTAISRLRTVVFAGALALATTAGETAAQTDGATDSTQAEGQDLSRLSCGQLWHERNATFARFGYCFQTERAINAFGRACFPPYGELPSHARSRVNEIIALERNKGCS